MTNDSLSGAEAIALTSTERALVDQVVRGEPLDLARGEPVDHQTMSSWDDTHFVRARVLRDILLGHLAPNPDPHGLRLRAARIKGRLDLDNVNTRVGIQLIACWLDGVDAANAHLPFLTLSECRLAHSNQPALDAEGLTTDADLTISQSVITAHNPDGAVTLIGARIGGQLTIMDTTIKNDSGPALVADHLHVTLSAVLRDGFRVIGTGEHGAIRMVETRIGGQLRCENAAIANSSGPALHADGLYVDQAVILGSALTVTGAGQDAAIRMIGARIGGPLTLGQATIINESGPALIFDGLQASQSVFLHDGLSVTAASDHGAVRMIGVEVGDTLSCEDATILNDSGPALLADGLQVDQDVLLGDGFHATGTDELGSVRMVGARIGGQLAIVRATISNGRGPALNLGRLHVNHNLSLTGIDRAATDRGLWLVLTSTRVSGTLHFDVPPPDPSAWIELDGLTYAGLPTGVEPADWLQLLQKATPRYAAQPYQHLAAAHLAAGHDGQARRVLIAQRQDQIHRHALTGTGERLWTRLTGLTLGYGYQPWRALIGLLATAASAVVLTLLLGAHGAVTLNDRSPTPGRDCSTVEQIGVGLDQSLPLVRTDTSDRCDTTTSTTGHTLTIAGWVMQLLAWAFATLFIAGFTAAVRRT